MTNSTQPPQAKKNFWVPIALLGVFFASYVFRAEDHVDPIYCDTDASPNAVDALMLSASWCGYCRRARNYFVDQDIKYCEYDVERSTEGAKRYAESGIRVVPIIFIEDEVLVGFDRREINQALVVTDKISFDEHFSD